MVSFTSGVSLWYRHCYKLWQQLQMSKTYDNIKLDFLWLQRRYWHSNAGTDFVKVVKNLPTDLNANA